MYKVWTPRPVECATRAEAIAAASAYERATGIIVAVTEVKMGEEATTNLLNVVKHIERQRVEGEERAISADDRQRRYLLGVSDGYQLAGAILRNMLLSMGVAIPEGM